MSNIRMEHLIRTDRLRKAYGNEVVLSEDGKSGSVVYAIVLEFDIHGRSYAVLRPEDAAADGEPSVFRVTSSGDGEYEIETIDDDDEWEDISELVDEALVAFPNESNG